jgi:type IV secretory pathway TraG/TraD family ATPase VirD4
MPSAADSDFSITRWIHEGQGNIYISSNSMIEHTLRPILSLFVDLLERSLLAMPDDYNRRLFFLLDEFGTLQRLTTIKNLLTLSRSKGGSVWIGIQDIGQIEKIYSRELRQAIINACGTNAIFSVADPDTAEFLARKIGKTKISYVDELLSMGVEDNRDGISLTRRERAEDLIMPADIMNMPDLTLLLKLPGYHLTKTKISYRGYKIRNEMFTLREGLSIEEIAETEAEIREKEEMQRREIFQKTVEFEKE